MNGYMGMSPQELQQMMQISEMGDRQKMLENQVRQAQQSQGRQYSTPIGALLGGLGDVGQKIGGTVAESKLSSLLRDRSKSIQALLEAKARQEQAQQQGVSLGEVLRNRQRPENNMLGQYFLQPPEMY